MKRLVVLSAASALGLGASAVAYGYSATADVTFTWASGGTTIGWTSNGANTFPDPATNGNNTQVFLAGGNNSTSHYNSDFAINSDYDAGTADDCLTPLPNYETITLRKYACRHSDTEAYYDDDYNAAPVSGAGPGAAASGILAVTDTTLTGTLTVISTTDEPSGATTAILSGVRTSNSAGNGFDGYNIRTADGSPFGNAWYGITTSATLTVDLTGTFTATDWTIDGGTVTFSDSGFACQQGGFGGSGAGTLCTLSTTGGGFEADGKMLSWGIDTDGATTGVTTAQPIQIKDSGGITVIATLSGVLAHLTLDVGGAIATTDGEFRTASGSAGGGCFDHVRWGVRPAPEVDTGIVCGTLSAGALVVTGTIVPPFPGFIDVNDVALSTVQTSNAVAYEGAPGAAISVSGDASSEYSIGCTSTFTATGGTIDTGEVVCVRHTSSATPAAAVDTTLDIGGVTDTFTSTTAIGDTTPDAFTLNPVTGVAPGSQQTSNTVTITGIDAASPLTITGDASSEYSINGGAFSNAGGATVVNNDTVAVRHTASAGFTTDVSTTLDVGGVSSTFTSTTAAVDTTPDAFTFTPETDAALSTPVTSNTITVSGINSPATLALSGDASSTCSVNGGAFAAACAATVSNGDTVAVQHTSAAANDADVTTTLTIGGIAADFVSTTESGSTGLREDDGGSSLDALILALLGFTALIRRRR